MGEKLQKTEFVVWEEEFGVLLIVGLLWRVKTKTGKVRIWTLVSSCLLHELLWLIF